jgi:hypothetical protein
MAEIEQILIVRSYAEATILESHLQEAEIPYLLQAFNDPAFGSFWRRNDGWGLLLAPAEYRERIEAICADLRGDGEPR